MDGIRFSRNVNRISVHPISTDAQCIIERVRKHLTKNKSRGYLRILEGSEDEATIEIDFELLRMQERSISIDVFVPYVPKSAS